MDFDLNTEQQMLQDSVRRFVERTYSFEARVALLKQGRNGSAANWRTFADNGWLLAAVPEEDGGLGGTVIETAILAEELGRALVLEPWLGSAVLATQTLVAGGTPAQRERWLAPMLAGSARLALAYSEPASRGLPEPVSLCARPEGGKYVLDGCKSLVIGAVDADAFIVSARVPCVESVTLMLVDGNAPGLSRRPLQLHDGTWIEELAFEGVKVEADAVLGNPGEGLPALRAGLAHGTVALCASLIGAMEKTIDLTAAYLKTRQQFGVPISSFQALQHRMADMAVEVEVARSMLHVALASMTNDDAQTQIRRLAEAKMLISRAAKYVCGQGIQLHGGIGMTEEYAVGHYFKHAIVADLLLGSAESCEAVVAEALQAA